MKNQIGLDKLIPLITYYSFDPNASVSLFDTEDEAGAELKKRFDEEVRIELEENGHVLGVDFDAEIDPMHTYAKIVNHNRDGSDDISEWTIGYIA